MSGARKNIKLVTYIEKNKLYSSTPFIVAITIRVKDDQGNLQETLHYVNNNEDLTIQGIGYTAFPFSIETEEIEGGISEVKLSIQDITRAVQQRMQAYGGGVGSEVYLAVYNADYLDQDPDVGEYFDVISSSASDYNVTFTLGVQNLLTNRFPPEIYLRSNFPLLEKGNLRY